MKILLEQFAEDVTVTKLGAYLLEGRGFFSGAKPDLCEEASRPFVQGRDTSCCRLTFVSSRETESGAHSTCDMMQPCLESKASTTTWAVVSCAPGRLPIHSKDPEPLQGPDKQKMRETDS